ncbi:MAG: hypothetical protein J0H74_03300 [Chitinophagaceae bacterium]|nr:hypothetical protein [Chitinophagaceae bacterium]
MNPKLRTWLIILSIPVAYALVIRFFFGIWFFRYAFTVMSVSFLLGLPFGVGYLTILLSPMESVRSWVYRIVAPMLPIIVFFMLTLGFGIEGWACWLMILPVFLILSILGGLTAGRYKLRKEKRTGKLRVSIVLCLPFLLSSVEHYIPHPFTRCEAYTSIDIHARADTIWNNVIRVKAISPAEDHGTVTSFLGFPRPIRAELNYAGVGGSRQAIFSKGLVFEELVKAYDPEKRMYFSIKADPHTIPSTTMDKHVVIGGDYFDVLDGTYELRRLGERHYRLHLYSHFILKTNFNFYASWWAGLIMKDIQNNILQVIRTRCQG